MPSEIARSHRESVLRWEQESAIYNP